MNYDTIPRPELKKLAIDKARNQGLSTTGINQRGNSTTWAAWLADDVWDQSFGEQKPYGQVKGGHSDPTSVQNDQLRIDPAEAKRFLAALGCNGNTRFRTFDDTKGAVKATCYPADQFDKLAAENKKGAGVFVVVNETAGDKDADVSSVRAVFVDLDGAPLEPTTKCGLIPHIVVESSPGRFHAYWLIDGCPLEQFKPMQQAIAGRFNGDKSICNLSRVMRLPGFIHQKKEPFLTKIISIADHAPFSIQQVVDGLQLVGFMHHEEHKTVNRDQSTGNRPGDDYNRRASWNEVLSVAGWTLSHTTPDGRGLWNKPGHTGQQSATTNYAGSDLLYCFSDSSGLPVNEGLNKFAAYTMLYHGGDYATAAQALSAQGYGDPIATQGPGTKTQPEEPTEPDLWPALSDDALPGWIGDFIRLACEHSEADPAAVLITLLCRFAAEIGSGPYVNVGDAKHRARTNAVIVGASSKARKGTSAKPVERLFAGMPTGARFTPGPLSSGEGLIFAVRDSVQEFDKKAGEYVVTDPGVQDKRLFVLDEEFAAALNCTKREGNTLSAIVRGFYDDGNAEPLTKTSRIKATCAHVVIVTHIVQLELTSLMNQVQMSNGFGNRFLWILARRQKLIALPAPMPDQQIDQLREIVSDRIHAAMQQQAVRMSAKATQLWLEAYPGLTMDYAGVAGSVVNRTEAHAVRLALIYALCSGHTEIEVDDLKAAFAVVEYSRKSAFMIFGSVPDDKRKLKILAALRTAPDNELSITEIRVDVFNQHIKADDLQKTIAEMELSKLVHTEKVSTGGAPKTIVKLSLLSVKSVLSVLSQTPDANLLDTLNTHKTLNTQGETVYSTLPDFDLDADGLPDFDIDLEPELSL